VRIEKDWWSGLVYSGVGCIVIVGGARKMTAFVSVRGSNGAWTGMKCCLEKRFLGNEFRPDKSS
jgi:hypothetical protein